MTADALDPFRFPPTPRVGRRSPPAVLPSVSRVVADHRRPAEGRRRAHRARAPRAVERRRDRACARRSARRTCSARRTRMRPCAQPPRRRCRRRRHCSSARLLDRDLWAVFADAAADGLDDEAARLLSLSFATSAAAVSTSMTRRASGCAAHRPRHRALLDLLAQRARGPPRDPGRPRGRSRVCRRTSSTRIRPATTGS